MVPGSGPHGRFIPRTWLALLTLAVLLAHLLVLRGGLAALDRVEPAPLRAFTTRTIEAPRPPPVQQAATPAPKLPRQPAAAKTAPTPLFAPVSEQNQAPAPASRPEDATILVAQAPSAAASAPETAPTNPGVATPAEPAAPVAAALKATVPASVRLKYAVSIESRGVTNHAEGELLWQQDGASYSARLALQHWLVGARTQTSQGQVTADGLAPTRFSDKFRSEVAAHFDRDKGRIIFSANTLEAPLLPGMQDRLSVFMQLAALLAGDPGRYPAGTVITLPVVGPRAADRWNITVGAEERLALPGGPVTGLKLVRLPQQDYDQKLELWLAPAMGYLPVRIRLTEASGDVADQRWQATQSP